MTASPGQGTPPPGADDGLLDEVRLHDAIGKALDASRSAECGWSVQNIARAAIEAYVTGEVIDR